MVIQESTLNRLLSTWKERMDKELYSEEYRYAIGECIYDLQELIDSTPTDQEFLQDVIANLPSPETEEHLMEMEAEEDEASRKSHQSVA